ncbi:MAG: DUF1403 family protein [Pseudomonadota bacterium]
MSDLSPQHRDEMRAPPTLPAWCHNKPSATAEAAAFRSGAALAVLHPWLAQPVPQVPQALVRDRLALAAAEACVSAAGRPERAADLRDEVHLLRPGESPGPAGAIFVGWRHVVRIRLKGKWQDRVAEALPVTVLPGAVDTLAALPAAGHADPVTAAADILITMRAAQSDIDATALVLSDIALARALGWHFAVPLLANGLSRADLRREDGALGVACHRAVTAAAEKTCLLLRALSARAAHLRQVAPKLRAKTARAALDVFLSEDAVAPPIALAPYIRGTHVPMTDRAARRLCDRLVDLGAVRELTGRSSFRLYGL